MSVYVKIHKEGSRLLVGVVRSILLEGKCGIPLRIVISAKIMQNGHKAHFFSKLDIHNLAARLLDLFCC